MQCGGKTQTHKFDTHECRQSICIHSLNEPKDPRLNTIRAIWEKEKKKKKKGSIGALELK